MDISETEDREKEKSSEWGVQGQPFQARYTFNILWSKGGFSEELKAVSRKEDAVMLLWQTLSRIINPDLSLHVQTLQRVYRCTSESFREPHAPVYRIFTLKTFYTERNKTYLNELQPRTYWSPSKRWAAALRSRKPHLTFWLCYSRSPTKYFRVASWCCCSWRNFPLDYLKLERWVLSAFSSLLPFW